MAVTVRDGTCILLYLSTLQECRNGVGCMGITKTKIGINLRMSNVITSRSVISASDVMQVKI